MPAYPYFPTMGYQPNYYTSASPYQYQPPAQQQPQQTTTQSPPSSILWVRNGQEAAMYPVAPNNAVALWDSGSPVIYLKQADASGKPSMKTYDLVERIETSQPQEGSNMDYATKSELAALAGVVKDVDGVIASLREDVDNLKAKTPVKRSTKKEDEE